MRRFRNKVSDVNAHGEFFSVLYLDVITYNNNKSGLHLLWVFFLLFSVNCCLYYIHILAQRYILWASYTVFVTAVANVSSVGSIRTAVANVSSGVCCC